MNKPLVIYHKNCLDGFGAAFCAWLKFGDEAEYIGLDYSDRADFMKKFGEVYVAAQETIDIYIIDFSFSLIDTQSLLNYANNFVWLDHHKSAFEEHYLEHYFNNELVYLKETQRSTIILSPNLKSGAMLAWEYFNPGVPVPLFIKHIDDRDRWQWKLDGTRGFCFGLSNLPQDFSVWEDMLAIENVSETRIKGEAIALYYDTQLQRAIEATKEICSFMGQQGLCCNLPPMFASEAGNALAKESGTFGATWFKASNGDIKWSLRSIGDYDVSAIAKQFGGGGHKNAAGFTIIPESGLTRPGMVVSLINTES